MIQYAVALVVLFIVGYIVYWMLERRFAWNASTRLRVWLLQKLHLYDTPVGRFTDYIMQKAKSWENTKVYFVLVPLIAGYGVFLTFMFMPWIFLNPLFVNILVFGGAGLIVAAVLVSAFAYIKYYVHYTKKEGWEVTVQESLTNGFRDHWPIAAVDELNPDDPRINRAHAVVAAIMERRRRERETGNGNPATEALEASSQAPVEAVAEESAALLPCRVCNTSPGNGRAKFCYACGAKLFPDEHYFLVTRGFCSESDPWFQFLVLTDCVLDRHRNPISQEFYAGKIPVNIPVSRMRLVRVGQVLNTSDGDQVEDIMIPVVMFTDSAEYTRRVTRQERGHPFSDEAFSTAGHTYDGFTSLQATELLEIAQQQLSTLRETKRHGKDESIAAAMEIIGTYLQSKETPKDKPSLRAKAWAVGKWVILIGVVVSLFLLFLVFGIPWLRALMYGVPLMVNSTVINYCGVWEVDYFLNLLGRPTLITSQTRQFFEVVV